MGYLKGIGITADKFDKLDYRDESYIRRTAWLRSQSRSLKYCLGAVGGGGNFCGGYASYGPSDSFVIGFCVKVLPPME